ncbi:MAG: chloride channel protein [Thermodesulfobacteriota bacterium]
MFFKERIGSFSQQFRIRLSQWFDRHAVSESGMIMLTALVVGVGAGLGAVLFRRLIMGVRVLSYEGVGGFLQGIAPFHILIIPALGGAIFGPLIYLFAREAKGHGVPEVMEAVALRGGRIRPRVAIIKAFASAICIGTGGSVGREGPIAQIGSALGSAVGQIFKLSDERIRSLVACGAAGGIAATFSAPIGASIFALEVILSQFHAVYFGAVVISAVTASVIANIFEGGVPIFTVPEYTLISSWELVLYVMLGIIAAFMSVSFTKLLYLSEDLWEKIRFPEYFKPILGGIALGVVGILTFKINGFPRVFGVGYDSITEALVGNLALHVIVALLFIKLFATIITLGSGGSGGIFAPSLFMGAMLGNAFGQLAHYLFPNVTAPAGAYALVGMAAFFGGAAGAPVTAILILFEMTNDYYIILPLMLATVVSTLIARTISSETIYTLKLSRRGVRLEQGHDIDVMQGVTVGEVMNTNINPVPLNRSLLELSNEFSRSRRRGLPVVDDAGDLVGIVSIQDLERFFETETIIGKTVADIATTEGLVLAYPNEPMQITLRRLGARDIGMLPVVEHEGSRKLVGMVHRGDFINAYNQSIVKRAHKQHKTDLLRQGRVDNANLVCVKIPPKSSVIKKRLSEIKLPEDCLIVSLRRGNKLSVPKGDTVLKAGDMVEIFGIADKLDEAVMCLSRLE